jgi:hypothetical protein
MTGLTANVLLTLWEEGEPRHPLDRALLMLHAEAAEDWDALADLAIGERNRRLLRLHAESFGPTLAIATMCPSCSEPLEFSVETAALMESAASAVAATYPVSHGDLTLSCRPLTSRDLGAVAAMQADPRRALALRCVVTARRGEQSVDPAQLDEAAIAAVAEALAKADPLADVVFTLQCPNCAAESVRPLDVVAFVWMEVTAHARRLMSEVDVLARVYHWREADILALDRRRRQVYLERALT